MSDLNAKPSRQTTADFDPEVLACSTSTCMACSTAVAFSTARRASWWGADQASRVNAELLLMFADNDERINAAWPPYEAALKAAGVRFSAFKYSGTQHGFNNDTTPRFDENAA